MSGAGRLAGARMPDAFLFDPFRPSLDPVAEPVPEAVFRSPEPPFSVYTPNLRPHQENQQLTIDQKTGEIRGLGWSWSGALVERYAMQSQARRALLEAWRAAGGQGRAHKVTRCRRWLRPRGGGPLAPVYAEVYRDRTTRRAHYGGTDICGSPWACPVCSAKIAERRAVEVRAAVDQWIASGGLCLFVTLTVPHTGADRLSPMIQRFRRALDLYRSGRAALAIRQVLGYVGLIRALENTWGQVNGWHPHSHEIWFCRPESIPLDALVARWQDSAQAAGFERPSSAHGFRLDVVQDSASAAVRLAEYLAKAGREPESQRRAWDAADELTRAHSKRGRLRRYTPWDFLRGQFDQGVPVAERIRQRELFAEYVQAFKGLAQLFWSRGLKSRFDLVDLSDEHLAEESREPADMLARLEPEQWDLLFRGDDHRATLLVLAQVGGADLIREFLASLSYLGSSSDSSSGL